MNCPLFFLFVFLNLTNRELEYFDECSSKKIENMSSYNLQLIQLTKLKKKRRNRQGKKIAISMTNCQKISAKESWNSRSIKQRMRARAFRSWQMIINFLINDVSKRINGWCATSINLLVWNGGRLFTMHSATGGRSHDSFRPVRNNATESKVYCGTHNRSTLW